MEIERLREFLDLADTMSFTKTARNMSITQPTLSRHIADLEHEVGAELFSRTTTSVSLTDAGRALYQRAVVMVADYSSLFSAVGSSKSSQKTTLRVAGNTMQAPTSRMLFRLQMLAARRGLPFRFAWHKTRSLTNEPPTPQAMDMLRSGAIDMAVELFAFDGRPPEDMLAVRLARERLVVLASRDSPLAGHAGLTADDMRSQTPVAFAVYRTCPAFELAPFVSAGLDPSRAKTVYVQNMLEVPEGLAGLGPGEVAPLEEEFCRAHGLLDGDAPGICALDVSDERFSFAYWALVRADERRPPVLAALDLAREAAEA